MGCRESGESHQRRGVRAQGKVYLFDRQWEKAISDFEEIVYGKSADYGYALHPDYDDLFRLYNGRHSDEMIFSIQSIDGNTAGNALDSNYSADTLRR